MSRRLLASVAATAAVTAMLVAGGQATRPSLTTAAHPAITPAAAGVSSPATTTKGVRAPWSRAPKKPHRVCDQRFLRGPSSPPAGAVVVRPGVDLPSLAAQRAPGTTFWLAPGVHTFGASRYEQVIPRDRQRFIGAPGAIIDGRRTNVYAFGQPASGVTVAYLTIRNFGESIRDINNEGVVNHDGGHGWRIHHNTIENNAGAGVRIGDHNTVYDNCLRRNGQYGFTTYEADGVQDIRLIGNEIAYNNTADWEELRPGCGCTGGGKFWETSGGDVVGNWVHHNRGVGVWADTNNTGFLFRRNFFAHNHGPALMYETSYNARIVANTFLRNGIVEGPRNSGFPTGAVYLSEAGSDPRVHTRFRHRLRVARNRFINNWAGVVGWENADRFVGSPANTSTGATTLVNPAATVEACSTPSLVAVQPLFRDCRWRTKNLRIRDNLFAATPRRIAADCTPNRRCVTNALFSNWGSSPDWSPYLAETVSQMITFDGNNTWTDNTYEGPWSFVAFDQGRVVGWKQWRGTYGQDQGSRRR